MGERGKMELPVGLKTPGPRSCSSTWLCWYKVRSHAASVSWSFNVTEFDVIWSHGWPFWQRLSHSPSLCHRSGGCAVFGAAAASCVTLVFSVSGDLERSHPALKLTATKGLQGFMWWNLNLSFSGDQDVITVLSIHAFEVEMFFFFCPGGVPRLSGPNRSRNSACFCKKSHECDPAPCCGASEVGTSVTPVIRGSVQHMSSRRLCLSSLFYNKSPGEVSFNAVYFTSTVFVLFYQN